MSQRIPVLILLITVCFSPLTPSQSAPNEHYTNALLHKYHLAPQDSPFTYKHRTEVYNELLGKSFKMPDAFEKIALEEHAHLNNSFFFKDIKMLHNAEKVRAYQLKHRRNQRDTGELIQAQTPDGHTIRGTLLNRHSDTLLVVGGGFTNHRELMAPFGDMFDKVDVLFFDYRGQGKESSNPLRPATWQSFSKRLFGIERKTVRLGQSEELDVHAIVSKALSQKSYSQVVGLGMCYSGLIFVKTAALFPKMFHKLILDGCWFSLQDAVEIIARDPGLILRPQVHSALANNWLVKQRWFQRSIMSLAQRLFNIDFNTVSVLDYAPNLSEDLEVLFLHGKKDVMIPAEHFEILWHATSCRRKTAIITSNQHVWNHLKQKELYKEVGELFMTTSYEQFSHLLITPDALIDHKAARLQRKL